MSSALRLIIFLWLVDLSLANYECQYSSYYGGLYCRHRPAVYYTAAGVGFTLLLISICCCCFCGFCSSAARDPVYVSHQCHNYDGHCCGQPNSVVVMNPSTCGHPTTMSYATPSHVSTRTMISSRE